MNQYIALSSKLSVAAGFVVSGSVFGQELQVDKAPSESTPAFASELMGSASNRRLWDDSDLMGGSRPAAAAEDFSMQVHGFSQFRYVWTHRNDSTPGTSEDATGFQNGRTKFIFTGNAGTKDIDYLLRVRFVTGTGQALLDYAYTNFNLGDGFKIRAGQFLTPMVREEVITDYELLFVERSVMDAYFTVGYTQGVQLSYEKDNFQAFGVISDGMATQNTDYTSTKEADWAVTGRANWKWAGDWAQAARFTGFRGDQYFGMLGAAATYQQGGETVGTLAVDTWQAMADAQVKGSGWNTYAAFAYRGTDPSGGKTFHDFGGLLQGGVFVSRQLELIAGWDIVVPDHSRTTGKDFNAGRAGFNYYISPESQAIKFTANVSWFPDKQSQSIVPVNTGVGVLSSASDNQFALQMQMQIVF